MSHDSRKEFYNRDRERDRARDWERDLDDYRGYDRLKRSSRSPVKSDSKYDDHATRSRSKDLWDNQFQDPNYSRHTYSQESSRYGNNYPSSYSNIYDDFPPLSSVPPAPQPPNITEWNRPQPPPAPTFLNPEDQIRKEAAIESEMRHQKAALSKQREEYIKKTNILKKELETLKDQRNELRGDSKRSPSPDTKRFLKENTKLQLEIQNKLKTIGNVVDMLNGIIGEEAQEVTIEDKHEKITKRKSRSPGNKKFNYVYYDPEMHWCRLCNEFPPTAKDYLNHLHSSGHTKMAAQHVEAPWHGITGVNEGFPSYPSAPNKRTPIRGLQFFVPSTAWYCKLCDQFIGDLHCASAHLKSVTHSKNYSNFVEQNPHWETDWMSDRQKAFEKERHKPKAEEPSNYTAHTIMFNKDGFHTKRKDSPPLPSEEKKKKKNKNKRLRKRKTSTSSNTSKSSSDSDHAKKKKKAKKQKDEPDEKTLSNWMSTIQMDKLDDHDRKLLDTLKARMKHEKTDEEKHHPSQKPARENERLVLDMHRKREEPNRDRVRAEREMRERRDGRDSRENRDDRSESRNRPSPQRNEKKPPEIKKMPFIGKMPVFKNLTKPAKTEEQKKEEEKKKEMDEALKKKREEMDAEIQKKVAEFKEKIAQAQLERQQAEAQSNFRAPPVALPPTHQPPPPIPAHHPPPPPANNTQHPPSNLPKDFQEALDIIFPAEGKQPEPAKQEIFTNMPPPSYQIGPVAPATTVINYPPPSIPMMPQIMMNYDINPPQLFQHRPQLYDNHVPVVPQNSRPKPEQKKVQSPKPKEAEKENGSVAKKKEVLDELAMLGIDASDVGAGI